jgi:hypothetical protein
VAFASFSAFCPIVDVEAAPPPSAVSRSEEGQQKELLLLDSNYQVLSTIPLDLGPRHFTADTPLPEALLALREGTLRPGDRLRLTVAQPLMEPAMQAEYQQLLDAGGYFGALTVFTRLEQLTVKTLILRQK